MKPSRLPVVWEIIIGIVVITLIIFTHKAIVSNNKYEEAEKLVVNKNYEEAIKAFEELGRYKDSTEKVKQVSIIWAEELLQQGDIVHAAMAYGKAGEYNMSCALYWDKAARGKTMSVERDYVIAVKTDGTVAYTADDEYKHATISKWTNIVAVSSHDYDLICGLKADGTVISSLGYEWTIGGTSYDISDWTDIIAISVDYDNVIGLKSDGTVVSANNKYVNFSQWNDIVSISCDNQFTIGLKSDGTVMAANNVMDPDVENYLDLSDMTNCTAILPSHIPIDDLEKQFYDVIGIKQDGTVVVSSNSDEFDYSDILMWTDISNISCYFNCEFNDTYFKSVIEAAGLKYDGTVVTTGMDVDVSTWTDIVAVFISPATTMSNDNGTITSNAAVIGLKSDGTIVIAGKEDEFDLSGFVNLKTP